MPGRGHDAQEPTGPDNTGQQLIGGRYLLAEPIGRGAMGTVWRARDELLDREVAVKEVRLPSTVSDAERANSYQRTLREARTAARLSHPGVAAVYDVVEELGRPWIVMELVPARSLDRVVAEDGPLSPWRAADMGRQVLAALTTAHAAGVLHRDVKPSNVLLAKDGRTVLTDFGIATVEGDPSLTQTGMVMGSPGFLAPERIRGGAATPASDLWSLGATIYAAVEGQGPYDRHGGVMTTMAAVVTQDPQPPKAAGPLMPVLSALLSRDPAQRPGAAAVARMLDAIGGASTGPGGTRHLAQTLLPAAILPPGGAPPAPPGPPPLPALHAGPPPAPPGPPLPALHAGAPPGVPGPLRPPPAMTPLAMRPAAMAPAAVGPVSMVPPPIGSPGALGPGSMGPGSVRNAAPRRKHRVITFVIIGVAIFVVAAVAAATIHRARSAGAGAKQQATGAGPGVGQGAGQGAAGSHRRGAAVTAAPAGFPLGFAGIRNGQALPEVGRRGSALPCPAAGGSRTRACKR